MFENHRENAEKTFRDSLIEVEYLEEKMEIEIDTPRQASRQIYRNNTPSSNQSQNYEQTFFIPYIYSLQSSLIYRFSEDNMGHFNLFKVLQNNITNTDEK